MADDSASTDGEHPLPSSDQELLDWLDRTFEEAKLEGDRPLGLGPIYMPIAGPDPTGRTHAKIMLTPPDPMREHLTFLLTAIEHSQTLALETAEVLLKKGGKVKTVRGLRLFVRECKAVITEDSVKNQIGRGKQVESSRLRSELDEAAGETEDENHFIFRPDGDGYFLKGFGESGHVSADRAIGLHDIFRLIQTPNIPVPMLELDAGPGIDRANGDWRSHQPTTETQGISDIKSKRRELQTDIDEAKKNKDFSKQEKAQDELDKLNETAMAMVGINGKPRDLNNPLNKRRPKFLKRKTMACEKLRKSGLKKLADHFDTAVSSVQGCMVYRPPSAGLEWEFNDTCNPVTPK